MTQPADSPSPAAVRAALDAAVSQAGSRPEPGPPLAPLPPMALARGRLHEVTGPARRALAAIVAGAAQAEGPVMWLRPAWRRDRLYPPGLNRLADPGALIELACPRAADVPWAAEEALRSGAVALVVAEFPVPPDLRQVRRLHLAAAEGLARARAGRGGGRIAPLGLALAAETVESALAGVDSRWRLAPLPPDPDRPPPSWRGEVLPLWRLERRRARDAPPAAWRLLWGPEGPALRPEAPSASLAG